MDEVKHYRRAIFKPGDYSEFHYPILPIAHSSCIGSQGLDWDPGLAAFHGNCWCVEIGEGRLGQCWDCQLNFIRIIQNRSTFGGSSLAPWSIEIHTIMRRLKSESASDFFPLNVGKGGKTYQGRWWFSCLWIVSKWRHTLWEQALLYIIHEWDSIWLSFSTWPASADRKGTTEFLPIHTPLT